MGRRGLAVLSGLLFATGSLGLLVGRAPASAQELQDQNENEEVLANLATGQVEMYVGRDGVAIGLLGNAFEPQSHPPLVIQLENGQIAILLGAVDWFYPASHQHVRLDARLPRLTATPSVGPPRLGATPTGDFSAVGLALLEQLRKLAGSLHAPVELPGGTPLVEVVLLSYTRTEGARIGDLQYKSEQEPLRGHFWQTLVDRPRPSQLYPPAHGERGRPIELSYPPGSSPAIADLLSKGDPRIAPVASRTAELGRVAKEIEQGETEKAHVRELADFLCAALPVFVPGGGTTAGELTSAKAPEGRPATAARDGTAAAVGVLSETGFQWVLPPPETEQPRKQEAGGKPQPPGAPTLRKPPPE